MHDLNDLTALKQALREVRDYTLTLYAHLTPEQWQVPYLSQINPPLWEIAHIGWFQEFWCLRYRPGYAPLPSRLPHADAMFDSRNVAHALRWEFAYPKLERIVQYLQEVLNDTLAALEKSTPEQRYFYRLVVFHEAMHSEAMLMTLQTLAYPSPKLPERQEKVIKLPLNKAKEVYFPGGVFQLGAEPEARFVFDNEKWAHEVKLSEFTLSTSTVTNTEYIGFIEDGGYQREEFWSPAGREWLKQDKRVMPIYWRKVNGDYLQRRYAQWQSIVSEEPVIHINLYEAEAYCCWAKRRLPSEAEWEFAATHSSEGGEANVDYAYLRPVAAYRLGSAENGMQQLMGNVWEWTASPFVPYPGFSPDPYREYSSLWFNTHQVLRGGSFATQSKLIHPRFRNFYTPERADMFAGFRTCALR